MALAYSSQSSLGTLAPPFSLPSVDGKTISLESFRDHRALLVVFMCNHCPYVIAVQDRINQIAKDYISKGVAVVGISSNDPNYEEEDSFENMKLHAKKNGFVFPYLFDETQSVAHAYDAVCTPDPYLYENVTPFQTVGSRGAPEFHLRYRGRIDDSWKEESKVKEKSLRIAIDSILEKKPLNLDQVPSMGCSIKWKELTPKK